MWPGVYAWTGLTLACSQREKVGALQLHLSCIHTYIHTTYIHTYLPFYLLDLSPPPLSFLPSPTPLQPLKLIIGRSWLVGLSGPLIFQKIEATNKIGFNKPFRTCICPKMGCHQKCHLNGEKHDVLILWDSGYHKSRILELRVHGNTELCQICGSGCVAIIEPRQAACRPRWSTLSHGFPAGVQLVDVESTLFCEVFCTSLAASLPSQFRLLA